MADGFIQLPVDGLGKKLDTEKLTIGASEVHRERMQIVGALAAQIAGILNSDPSGNDYGLAVRPIEVVFPASSLASQANLAAGSSADLDAAIIPSGKTGKLFQVTLTSSVACKWVIKKRSGAVVTTIDTVMTSGIHADRPSYGWRPPHKEFAALSGNGVDTYFRVTVTNLDARNPADVYATFWWDEV